MKSHSKIVSDTRLKSTSPLQIVCPLQSCTIFQKDISKRFSAQKRSSAPILKLARVWSSNLNILYVCVFRFLLQFRVERSQIILFQSVFGVPLRFLTEVLYALNFLFAEWHLKHLNAKKSVSNLQSEYYRA